MREHPVIAVTVVAQQDAEVEQEGNRPRRPPARREGMLVGMSGNAGAEDQDHQRRQRKGRIAGNHPAARAQQTEGCTSAGQEQERCIEFGVGGNMPVDLVQAGEQPPSQSPDENQDRNLHREMPRLFEIPLDRAVGEQSRRGDEHAAEEKGIGNRIIVIAAARIGNECDAGGKLQQQAERTRQPSALACADPVGGSALECPCGRCPAAVEGQRYCQCREDDAQCQECLDQHAQRFRMPAMEHAGEHEIKRSGRHRAPGCAELDLLHQPGLQSERDQWRAEDDGAVDVMLQLRRLPQGEKDRDCHVLKGEQHQEGFGAGEELGPVEFRTPGRTDAESEYETEHIERPPCLEKSDAEHACIEHEVVAEQHHVAAATGRREHRRQKTTRHAEYRQRHRVLKNRERGGERRNGHEQEERDFAGNEIEQPEGPEHDQVQQTHATALHRQCVNRLACAQPPADHQHHHRAQRNADQPDFDRNVRMFIGVFEKEGHAEEQHHHADSHQRIAAGQPRPCTIDRPGFRLRLNGLTSLRGLGNFDRGVDDGRLHRGRRDCFRFDLGCGFPRRRREGGFGRVSLCRHALGHLQYLPAQVGHRGFKRGEARFHCGCAGLFREEGKHRAGQRAKHPAPDRSLADPGETADEHADQQSDEPHDVSPRPA